MAKSDLDFLQKTLAILAYVAHTRDMNANEIPRIGDTVSIRTARRTYVAGQIVSLDFAANTGVFRTPAGRKVEFSLTGTAEYMRGSLATGYVCFTYGVAL